MINQEQVVLNGRYELHRRVGRGGMAEVYLARDRLLDRLVAIKILFPEFATDPSFVARFRREAQAAANLNHPNIVNVYDWGKERGTYYIVMEYVDGRTIADLLRADGPIEAKKAASIAADVAAALGFAHRKGVVHRDVKPGNVLITDSGEVKVADFGIARALTSNGEENLTQTGSVMGTATYFSPEQAQDKDIDARTDLYSLGVVLYEMAAGKPPFSGTSPVAIAYKHVQEQVPPLSEQAPGVPAAYEAITNRALAKDPADRYPDATAMRSDLLRFRDGRPVNAGAVAPAAAAAAAVPVAAVAANRAAPPVAPAPTPIPLRGRPNDEVHEYEDGSHSGRFFAAILALLLVLGALLFLFGKQLGIFDKPVKQAAVPTAVDSRVADAQKRLEAAGFKVAVTSREDPNKPGGFVLSQDPTARRQAREGSTVKLVVSSGPGQANLDGVLGLPLDQAKAKLLALGFTVPPTTITQPDLRPADQVIGTDPPSPGGPYPKNQQIRLVLSAPVVTNTTAKPIPTTTTPRPTTTRAPVTATPTTRAPVTAAPTTRAPVTAAPTTRAPVITTPPVTTTPTRPPSTTTTSRPATTTSSRPATTTTTRPPSTTTTSRPTSTTSPPTTTTLVGGRGRGLGRQ